MDNVQASASVEFFLGSEGFEFENRDGKTEIPTRAVIRRGIKIPRGVPDRYYFQNGVRRTMDSGLVLVTNKMLAVAGFGVTRDTDG
ncbi:MAG: hypothetical protein FJ308_18685 [Planctomycetes bacterium]|nr:hypothetical protein [Planctomycetota bacterium]